MLHAPINTKIFTSCAKPDTPCGVLILSLWFSAGVTRFANQTARACRPFLLAPFSSHKPTHLRPSAEHHIACRCISDLFGYVRLMDVPPPRRPSRLICCTSRSSSQDPVQSSNASPFFLIFSFQVFDMVSSSIRIFAASSTGRSTKAQDR